MNTIKIFFVLLFFTTSMATAQSTDEKEIATRVEHLRKAMLDADKTQLDALTAPELSYGHSSGFMEDKAAFIEAIVSGKNDFTRIDLANHSIKFAGSTAIVRHTFNADVDGKTVNIGVLQIWQKQNNAWKLLARQAFKL